MNGADSAACREVAATMTDEDLVTAVTVLGADSPLLPAVRRELLARLANRNQEATR